MVPPRRSGVPQGGAYEVELRFRELGDVGLTAQIEGERAREELE
jgi:hypothetical protein